MNANMAEKDIELAVALVRLLCDGYTKGEVMKALELSPARFEWLWFAIRCQCWLPYKVRNYPRNRATILANAEHWRTYRLETLAIRTDYEARLHRHPVNE